MTTRDPHPIDGPAVVDQAWPYDGPHTADTVREAAAAITHLTRYMINALHNRDTVAYGPDLAAVISSLTSGSLPTLLRQLAAAADRVASTPALYDDRRDRPGATTAAEVALVLGEDAYTAATTLARHLDEAAGLASHLGHDTTDDQGNR